MLTIETDLKESKDKGMGLFAAHLVKEGSIWWIRNVQFDKLITEKEWDSYSDIAKRFIKEYGFLEATGNWHLCIDNARFTNHSDSPNTLNNWNEKGELISCIAKRDINQGEEIFSDYKELCITCKENLGFENKE